MLPTFPEAADKEVLTKHCFYVGPAWVTSFPLVPYLLFSPLVKNWGHFSYCKSYAKATHTPYAPPTL